MLVDIELRHSATSEIFQSVSIELLQQGVLGWNVEATPLLKWESNDKGLVDSQEEMIYTTEIPSIYDVVRDAEMQGTKLMKTLHAAKKEREMPPSEPMLAYMSDIETQMKLQMLFEHLDFDVSGNKIVVPLTAAQKEEVQKFFRSQEQPLAKLMKFRKHVKHWIASRAEINIRKTSELKHPQSLRVL